MHKPGDFLTVTANDAIAARRIVDIESGKSASQAASKTAANLGVSELACSDGDSVDVVYTGIVEVEAGGDINHGDLVASDSSGKAVAANAGDMVLGVAIGGASAGEYVSVRISPGRSPGDISNALSSDILSSYATKAELSDYATSSSLSSYATKAELSDYATSSSLSSYATKAELSDYATSSSLSNYATKAELSDYATSSSLSSYATKAELSGYAPKANKYVEAAFMVGSSSIAANTIVCQTVGGDTVHTAAYYNRVPVGVTLESSDANQPIKVAVAGLAEVIVKPDEPDFAIGDRVCWSDGLAVHMPSSAKLYVGMVARKLDNNRIVILISPGSIA